MGCGMSMVKYILFLFNLLCAICGALIIAMGTLIIISLNKTDNVDGEYAFSICLIVLGSIIFLIAFFGCCGAIKESYCMAITYVILLLILLLIQIGVVWFIHSVDKEIEDGSRKLVESKWKNRIIDPEEMDELQLSYKCCGNESPQDYRIHGFGGYFPRTCCEAKIDICTEDKMHKTSCKEAHVAYIKKTWENVKYGNIVIAALEGAGILGGCCLINNIRNIRRRTKY